MQRRVLAVGAMAAALLLAGCGASNDAAQPSRTVPPGTLPTTVAPTTTTPVTYACTPETDPLTIDAGKPTVEVPTGDAPTELVTTDITVGDGPVAESGDKVQMQYVGVLYSDGTEFDSSWSREAQPFEFTLGPEAQVIPGWNQGIEGMALGGRRQLVIPPDLAYGDQANGEIPAGSTLVFVVDLVQVCKPEATPTESPTGTDVVPTDSSVPTDPSMTTVPTESTSTTSPADASTSTTTSTTAAP
jgi:peptidylprolyl isomerase